MPTVVISIDCEGANAGKCYARELVQVAEENMIPLTWLLYVSEKDPLSNLDLYYNEFFHRIPSWHELGLLVHFENSRGYMADPNERGDLIRIGRDALKSRHVKPTSFRAHAFDLMASDLKHLEDGGFLVDGSSCPGSRDKHGVARPPAPGQPYHPSYDDLNKDGSAKILSVPLASHNGVCGYLDHGWDAIQPVLENSLANLDVVHLALTDSKDDTETFRKTVAYCKSRGARFLNMTQIATL